MQETIVTNYDILISAPSDVSHCVDKVREAIYEYNSETGFDAGVRFTPKDWGHDTMPLYRESAQSTINEQIVDPADAVIAIFGAKFGTPTKKYSSGTLEEIERSAEMGKDVLVFFGEGTIVPIRNIDAEQLKKRDDFKKNFPGLYETFDTIDELKEKVKTNLKRLAEKLKKKNDKDIKLYTYDGNELINGIHFYEYDFLHGQRMQTLKNKIESHIRIINSIHLAPKKEQLETKEVETSNTTDNNMSSKINLVQQLAKFAENCSKVTDTLFPKEDIKLDTNIDGLIRRYCQDHDIPLDDNYLEIGNACYQRCDILGTSIELSGSSQEITKANSLIKVPNLIRQYYGYHRFFNQFGGLKFVSFVLKNESNRYADDISVKLFIPKDAFFDMNSLFIDSEVIAEQVKTFVEDVFETKNNVDIDDMEQGREIYPLSSLDCLNNFSYCKKYFKNSICNLYPCIINTKGNNVVLKFELTRGIKQFTAQFLCAKLMFKYIPDKIEYEITSKSFGHIIKGELKNN